MSNEAEIQPKVGDKVFRLPYGRQCVVTDLKPGKVKIKYLFWHGWVNIATFRRKWKIQD